MKRTFTLSTFLSILFSILIIKAARAQTVYYTVNQNAPASATNFTSFSALITSLTTNGVNSPVVVDVEPNSGTYNERLLFTYISGASATNTVRINGNGVQVEYASGSTTRPLLVFDSTQYVTVDSLYFKATGARDGWGALFTNSSAYDSIIRCEFDMSHPDAGNPVENVQGIVFANSYTDPTISSGHNSRHCYVGYNRILGNDGFRGMSNTFRVAGRNDSSIIAHNTAENFHINSAVISDSAIGVQFLYNDFFRDHQTDAAEFRGIIESAGAYAPGLRIIGNRFHHPTNLNKPREFVGIRLSGTASADDPALVANNVMYNIRGLEGRSGSVGGTLYGIYINQASHHKIYHNTIDFAEILTGSEPHYGIYVLGTNPGVEIKNNNISITEGSSGVKYGFYYEIQNSVTGSDVQMNNFYVNSNQSGMQYYGHYGAGNYNDHAQFVAANPTFEQGSPEADPQYVNVGIGDLHVQNSALIGVGLNLLADVPLDVEKDVRASVPTLGAFESAVPIDAASNEFISPSGQYCADSQEVKMSIYNAGTINFDSVEVHWSVNGIVQPMIHYRQTLVPAGNPGRNMDTLLLGKVYIPNNTTTVVKAWTAMPNGQQDIVNGNDTLTQQFQATHYYVTANQDSICIGEDAEMTLHPSSGYNIGDLGWQLSDNGINWSNLPNTDQVTYTEGDMQQDRWFRVYIGGDKGCYSDSIKITVMAPPVVDLGNDTTVCNEPALTLKPLGSYNRPEYRWSTNETTPSIDVHRTGVYHVAVTVNGCTGKDSIQVIFDTVIVDLSQNEHVLCAGGNIVLSSAVSYIDPLYQWSTGATTPTIVVYEPGLYKLTVEDKGCSGSDTITIIAPNIEQNLGEDKTLCRERPINVDLHAYVPSGASALWSTGATTPDITVYEGGVYWVKVSYPPCEKTDTIIVDAIRCDCQAGMPTAFSPNGDGLNDVFAPLMDPGCPVQQYNFRVFNRYGQMVYQSNKRGEGWDGTYGSGQPADVGTYMYVLTYGTMLENDEPKVVRGDVTLIR